MTWMGLGRGGVVKVLSDLFGHFGSLPGVLLTQHMSELATPAIPLAPVDDIVVSLRLGTGKTKALFLGLPANSKNLSVWSLRLRNPVFAPVVDDVLNRAHIESLGRFGQLSRVMLKVEVDIELWCNSNNETGVCARDEVRVYVVDEADM